MINAFAAANIDNSVENASITVSAELNQTENIELKKKIWIANFVGPFTPENIIRVVVISAYEYLEREIIEPVVEEIDNKKGAKGTSKGAAAVAPPIVNIVKRVRAKIAVVEFRFSTFFSSDSTISRYILKCSIY
jgi:hypothetical protein